MKELDVIKDLFETFAGDSIANILKENEPKPVEYPITFPRLGECRLCRNPQELHEEMNEFVVRYGFTSFEFDGNKVTITNDRFHELRDKVSRAMTEDYEAHRGRNFD